MRVPVSLPFPTAGLPVLRDSADRISIDIPGVGRFTQIRKAPVSLVDLRDSLDRDCRRLALELTCDDRNLEGLWIRASDLPGLNL